MVISKFRLILCVLVCIWGISVSLPNILSDKHLSMIPSFFPKDKVRLGLDLRGGSQLVLAADLESAVKTNLLSLLDSLRDNMRKNKLKYRNIRNSKDKIIISLRKNSDKKAIQKMLTKNFGDKLEYVFNKNFNSVGSLESSGQTKFGQFELTFQSKFQKSFKENIMMRCVETLKKRVDSMGTVEPNVLRQGNNEILVQVPGLNDPAQLKAVINKTAKLTFHKVNTGSNNMRLPLVGNSYDGETIGHINVEKKPVVTGEQLTNASEQLHAQDNTGRQKPVVSFNFDTEGARRISKLTRENIGRQFAIVLDGKVISAPVIQSHIPNGSGMITGRFTLKEAKALALLMRSGALPTDLKVIEEKTIGADLGEDSIRAGQNATILSIVLVAVFMLLIYSAFGIIADLALAFNIILLFACLSTIGATLTLPGIAGIALTIGMAVDANVLIFERIREEIRSGISMTKSINLGFEKALSTIIDSNLTTLIGALMLFVFGSDSIKGFAVTLALGIITSMFTAITLTRTLIEIWYKIFRSKLKLN